ncbi:MAG TPA: hypothetical protein VF473_08935 [Cyclobacteriaceae bacterium]
MKRLSRNISFLLLVALYSCVEDPQIPPSNISFSADYIYYSEFDGIFLMPVTLDKPQFSYGKVEFDTSYPNPSTSLKDFFYLNNLYPLTYYGNQKMQVISGKIYDDTLRDGNDTVRFTLKSSTSNINLPSDARKRRGTLVVIDDDNIPSNQMKVQLKWTAEGARIDRSDADFDLTLANNVVLAPNDGGITSMNVYRSSKNKDTFESFTIDESAPDTDYYFIVEYKSRTPSVTGDATPLLKLSGFGNADRLQNNLWNFSFKKTEVNYYSWLGPFKKQGRSFRPNWK